MEGLKILPPSWDTPAAKDFNSVILGFKLSGSSSKNEWKNLKDIAKKASYRIGVDKKVECIQGIAFKKTTDNKYNMYLSRTTDVSFSAAISVANITLNKKELSVKESKFYHCENLPGTEGIVFIDEDLHILYESGALSKCDSFFDSALWSESLKNCTDVIWKVNEQELLAFKNLSKVTGLKLKSTAAKKATVSWEKLSSVSGYIVEYSTSKKFTKKTTKTVKIKKGKTTKTTLKKLKSGKKYYVRVKAYKTVNKKAVYGAYSSVKTVKIK